MGSISFSNKGLLFAVCCKNTEICKVYNLRKLGKEVIDIKHKQGLNVNSVNFDYYGGNLLTSAGHSLNIYAAKLWNDPLFVEPEAHESIVNVAKFSPSGAFIASGSEDRFMKIYGLWIFFWFQ